MTITKDNARWATNDYINFGNAVHFKYNGQPITGFFFTRKELNDLFKDDINKKLFLMLALSGGPALSNKYLNLIIGSRLGNTIDVDHLIISSGSPYTGTITTLGNIIKQVSGDPITLEHFRGFQNTFTQHGSDDHLTSTLGVKVKGYELDGTDFDDLGLRIPVTQANTNDQFAFMPVIRALNLAAPFDRPYLSIAVARFNPLTLMLVGTIVEYCLPCPNACPSNYPIQ